jgi:lipoyl-dependent peroxiredoxin
MPARTANAEWKGSLPEGSGKMAFGSGAYEGNYSFKSRMEEGPGTNPEELIAAAHAGCFSMAFAHVLSQAGFTPTAVRTKATVRFDKVEAGFAITGIHLSTEATVPGIENAAFQEHAHTAKVNCPVSKALAAVDIKLDATLV